MIPALACLVLGAAFLVWRVRRALEAFVPEDMGNEDDSIFSRGT